MTLIDPHQLTFANNQILEAWLPSLTTNMAASVYCSGKLLRTFARNSQSRGVNACKFLSLSGVFIVLFFQSLHHLRKKKLFQIDTYVSFGFSVTTIKVQRKFQFTR